MSSMMSSLAGSGAGNGSGAGGQELDCQACGACCHGDDGWVHVDAADDARVEASASLARLVVLTRHGGYVKRSLKMIHGACAALETIDDGSARPRFSCRVYPDRPSVCREVEKGSPTCVAARRAKGLFSGGS